MPGRIGPLRGWMPVVCVLGVVVAGVAGGCAPGAPPRAATPAPAPQWRVSAVRGALPVVVAVHGRTLVAEKLDSTATVTLWTAPAETTPTILAVDQPGGRIAVLLRAAPTIKFEPAGRFLYPPQWRDAGIEVLSADGSARHLSVRAVTRPTHVTVETTVRPNSWSLSVTPGSSKVATPAPGSTIRSIDATIPDLVTSGAFLGSDLVLTTQQGAEGRWGASPGTPLLLTGGGATRPLSRETTPTSSGFAQFCQLGDGRVLGVRGSGSGPFQTQHSASLVALRGSELVTASPAYTVGWQQIGHVAAADATASFAYHYQGYVNNEFVVESLADGGWKTSAIDVSRALGFNNEKNFGSGQVVVGSPQAGPGGALLAWAVTRATKGHPSYDATIAPLVQFNADGTAAAPSRVLVPTAYEDDDWTMTRSWTYVARFGR